MPTTASAIDEGLVLFFPGPHSFTGEDVLELQGHGGPVVLRLLLRRCLELGARLAAPGEFSERAFLNDKLDLAQAEAIADLIEASSEPGGAQRRALATGRVLASACSAGRPADPPAHAASKPRSTSPRKRSTSSPTAMC